MSRANENKNSIDAFLRLRPYKVSELQKVQTNKRDCRRNRGRGFDSTSNLVEISRPLIKLVSEEMSGYTERLRNTPITGASPFPSDSPYQRTSHHGCRNEFPTNNEHERLTYQKRPSIQSRTSSQSSSDQSSCSFLFKLKPWFHDHYAPPTSAYQKSMQSLFISSIPYSFPKDNKLMIGRNFILHSSRIDLRSRFLVAARPFLLDDAEEQMGYS